MEKQYYAKSVLSNGAHPTVAQHLKGVADKAGEFAAEFGCENEGRIAGMFHDFGKYGDRFQQMLNGRGQNIDHAICGAAALYELKKKKAKSYRVVIEAVNGHHDGLAGMSEMELMLHDVMRTDGEFTGNNRKIAAISGVKQFESALAVFQRENGVKLNEKITIPPDGDELGSMLHTRMVFSCLVDADYSVSAYEEDNTYFDRSDGEALEPEAALQRLYEHRETVRVGSTADSVVNGLRDELFRACGNAGEGERGLFTLTAPTGTGKTLALLHFALRHCAKHGGRRIIVVLPFLTLSDQIADTYRSIFPDVLIDNSQSELNEDSREYAARWSAPVIITTTVRFFEGLFSAQPTVCRKLHSIANSVVLFDESQSLPPHVTSATLNAVKALCERYGTTMVFSTATQPDFGAIPGLEWKPTEIYSDNRRAYDILRRVNVDWRLESPTSLESIAEEMSSDRSVCAIVNLRRHGRKLYKLLKDRNDEGLFFLTTDLCTAHRRQIVDTVKERLDKGLPCRVVATQCIEAGVDLDFDVMYRAVAPLDAIIQAAGRCNRNGRLPDGGRVIVFIPDEEGRLYPDDSYGNKAETVRLLNALHEIDINSPEHIREYYGMVFERHKDSKKLDGAISARDYESVEREYKLIKNQGNHVIVPYVEQNKLYYELAEEIKSHGLTKLAIKRAAAITVTAFENDPERYCERLYYSKNGRPSIEMPSDYYVLRPQFAELYSDDMGLQFPDAEMDGKKALDNDAFII